MIPKHLQDLVDALRILPSIGEKSAFRMALYLLEQENGAPLKLANAIINAQENIVRCEICNALSEKNICPICSNPSRDNSVICVVERPSDMLAIEKNNRFNGVYHVLGGLISPISGITPDKLSLNLLKKRVEEGNVAEIIIALGFTGEAETTVFYIQKVLSQFPLTISKLAQGLSSGLEIIHADKNTLNQAIDDRKIISKTIREEIL
ncbi:MAG: recombination mediator RecR [Chitinivibrionia bacterium]|nr:recombination mediator RecR [Chitinivibrionia bacterium]MCL1947338.1 recombination mediator RecR [Chitinivibrionia bacterium]